MRFLLTVHIPVEAGNNAARNGKLGETIQSILADQDDTHSKQHEPAGGRARDTLISGQQTSFV